jgi:hypothetical protein
MESQRAFPRAEISEMLEGDGVRVGVVESAEEIRSGREDLNAFRQFIVRGIPLKLMHFRPTSRMVSAVWIASFGDCDEVMYSYSAVREAGEFIVIVAAVYQVNPLLAWLIA